MCLPRADEEAHSRATTCLLGEGSGDFSLSLSAVPRLETKRKISVGSFLVRSSPPSFLVFWRKTCAQSWKNANLDRGRIARRSYSTHLEFSRYRRREKRRRRRRNLSPSDREPLNSNDDKAMKRARGKNRKSVTNDPGESRGEKRDSNVNPTG